MYLQEIKTLFHKELNAIYPKEEVDSFFYLFMENYLKLERFALVLQPNIAVSKEEEQAFFEGLSRLRREEPVQYILGEADFMGLKFKVNPHVLIPRPETEGLVSWIINNPAFKKGGQLKILDIGTGSGCIAISLAKFLPQTTILALDISWKTLEVAQKNAHLNHVEIEFINANILKPGLELGLELDCIVSNPPYVRDMERDQMTNNVKQYEPETALFVSDTDPLKFYEAIISFSTEHLRSKGSIYFEVNQYLAKQTQTLLLNNHFNEVELREDIFGNFRMLKGVKP